MLPLSFLLLLLLFVDVTITSHISSPTKREFSTQNPTAWRISISFQSNGLSINKDRQVTQFEPKPHSSPFTSYSPAVWTFGLSFPPPQLPGNGRDACWLRDHASLSFFSFQCLIPILHRQSPYHSQTSAATMKFIVNARYTMRLSNTVKV